MNLYQSLIALWAADTTLNGFVDSTLIAVGKQLNPSVVPPYATIETEDDPQVTVTSRSIIDEEVIRISVFTDSQAKSRGAILRLRDLLREKKNSLEVDDGLVMNVRRITGLKTTMAKGVYQAYDDYAIMKTTSR